MTWHEITLALSTRRGVWDLVAEGLRERDAERGRYLLSRVGCRVKRAKIDGVGWSVWAMLPPEGAS